jgi:hypothetical protein
MLIDPYKSVDDLFFTDTRQEIRRKLNQTFDSGVYEFAGLKEYYDYFNTSGLKVLYDVNNNINAFEFFDPGLIFNGLNLTTEPFLKVFEMFSYIDPDLTGDATEFTSYKYGIGGIISYDTDSDIALAEAIIVFKNGYYDCLKNK